MKKTLLYAFCVLAFNVSSQVSAKLYPQVYDNTTINMLNEHIKNCQADTLNLCPLTAENPIESVARSAAEQHFPYPVIFIHGLTGSSDTWTTFYTHAINQNWTYGGWLKFCLNTDGDNSFSNITNQLSDVADFNTNVGAADFYLINFNTDANGTGYGGDKTTSTLSNQAAIIKQGFALKNAIKHVLKATGKDKVILFGHSMGGLAAREYLQNKINWQADGQHHVAKLITSGTPHGGSNATTANLFGDVNERSDAVRDLRRSYLYSGSQGVYLFGGIENNVTMHDFLLGDFHNTDVNCNGQTGNIVQGLNEKSISTNLDFACIIGDWRWDLSVSNPGDGVVEVKDAQLKKFYTIRSETFNITSSLSKRLHTQLTSYTSDNFKALDEPDYFHLSYTVKNNTLYNGFITPQASDAETQMDYDDYVFTLTQPQYVNISVGNIAITDLGVSLFKSSNLLTPILTSRSENRSKFTTNSIYLTAGTYYLEIDGWANSISWGYPYNFSINTHTTTPTVDVQNPTLKIYPNPTNDRIYFDNLKAHTEVAILNIYGSILKKANYTEGGINLTDLAKGLYFLRVQGDNTAYKIIKL